MLGAASSPAPAPEAPPPAHPAPLPPPPRALPPAPAAPALGALQAFLSMGNIKFGSIGRGHLLQRRPRRLLARSRPNWYLHFSGLCPAAAAVAPVGAVWTKCESLKAVRLVWCRLSSGLAARRPPAPLAAAPPAAAVVAATADTAPVAPPKPRWLRALPLPLPPPLASPRAFSQWHGRRDRRCCLRAHQHGRRVASRCHRGARSQACAVLALGLVASACPPWTAPAVAVRRTHVPA
mmetsp:Transcript_9817/g.30489  ORF Transcript_9817/g.30489 Transcript_9817/m.30489 type:complete len:236 (+) Transcript_9817:985-1692(+)